MQEEGIFALGSTMAVGWIILDESFLWFRLASFPGDAVHHHATDGGFRHAFSVHKDFAGHASNVAFPDLYGHLNAKLVTGHYWTAEARTLNSGKDHQLCVAVLEF